MATETARNGLRRCMADCQRIHITKIWSLIEKHNNQIDRNWANDATDYFVGSFDDDDKDAKKKWNDLVNETQKGRNKFRENFLREIDRFNKCLQNCQKQARMLEMREELIKQVMTEKLKIEKEVNGKKPGRKNTSSKKKVDSKKLKIPPLKK